MFRSLALHRVAVLVAAAALVALTLQLRALRAAHREQTRRAADPAAGIRLPEVTLATSAGDSVRVGTPAAGERQLVLAYSSNCPHCRASAPAWQLALATLDSAPVPTRVVLVALDSIAEAADSFAHAHGLRGEVVRLPPRWWRAMRVTRVPAVMLVDSGGRLRYGRTGALIAAHTTDSLLHAIRTP